MDKRHLTIKSGDIKIPAVLWGEPGPRLLLAVHGMSSHKEDTVVAMAAQEAVSRGMCALSFDLPEHGERAGAADYPCKPWNGLRDLLAVYRYAEDLSENISVFACSLGAYLTMLALPDIRPERLLFLSPIVNMRHVVEGMMASAGVSEKRLEAEKLIKVPGLPDLDWEYYCYTKAHPVLYGRRLPMAILRGENDLLCAETDAGEFAGWYKAGLTVLPGGEHYFHTESQLAAFARWLQESIGIK